MCRFSLVITFCLLFFCRPLFAITDKEYLPDNTEFLAAIPSPSEILGAPVGEWHVRHDQLVNYMRILAEKSDRVSLIETGRTHENRPLLLLAFSSPENQHNLAKIRSKHLDNLTTKSTADDPLIIWMGYSVHGDEPSGSNASLLIAYYLAAGQNSQVDALLKDNIVLLDPSLNPDGLARFAQWANMHKGKNLVGDPNHREHTQAWPSGRTNHYWFDLNRDWLLLTHPESKARVKQFHQWRPHVLTDFHEMGSNSTYFFQPGITARKNPWTPLKNVELTEKLAEFHAAALDSQKQLYFTQESFDDFYYGKGSTYPDAHGTIAILFEQASSRGHLQETVHGALRFSDTIQNQITTSLSTFKGALANKNALLDYPAEFAQLTKKLIKDDSLAGYILTEKDDKTRFKQLLAILDSHKIDYHSLTKEVVIGKVKYDPLYSIFVPLEQAQYRLIKSLFSTRQKFDDNTFYDVSNWNLPLAFNIQYEEVVKKIWRKMPLSKNQPQAKIFQQAQLPDDAYAFAFSWQDSKAPKLLQRLLAENLNIKIAGEAFVAQTTSGSVSFAPGAVIIAGALEQPEAWSKIIAKHATDLEIKVWPITSGLTRQGLDLGSRKVRSIDKPQVLIVGGKGTSQYEVGEAWHYLDQRVDMPVSIVDLDDLAVLPLDRYSHMIWVKGNYTRVADKTVKRLESWIENGGVLIGQKSAAKWFSQQKWLKADFLGDADINASFDIKGLKYADRQAHEAKQLISGAVFNTNLDTSHPLAFGYTSSQLPVFRNGDNIMLKPDAPFMTVARYTESPLLAGYAASELEELVANSAAIVAHNYGRGKVIAFADNVNFRGYWYGTSRLLSNAIFMSGFIDVQE
ncbi:MAG: hypothetical protein ACI88A_004554 [Paraglaciecola sp.]|jgi:hypothetical protein